MKLLKCAVYLALIGVLGFFAGRLMPKRWFKPGEGWFGCFPFEKNGVIYEKLGIRKWQNKVLDMSRILPCMMPAKNLCGDYEKRLPVMILETCVAEFIHLAVGILGVPCLWMWPGVGGMVVLAIHIILLNLPFILIQRYNRPRLLRLQQKLLSRKKQKEDGICVF